MEIKKDFSLLEVGCLYMDTLGNRITITRERHITGYLSSYPFVGSNCCSYTDTGVYCLGDRNFLRLTKQIVTVDENREFEIGDTYFAKHSNGRVSEYAWTEDPIDWSFRGCGNCFPTREEAERYINEAKTQA